MKNSILYSSPIIFSLLLTSCIGSNRSVPQRMDSFVDNAELKSDSYSAEDWEKSEATFEKLFGYNRTTGQARPTNSEYIAILADEARR